MIGIEINQQFLDLGDESIRLEKVNSSFISELFQGDFSFPFTVSNTENNLKLLGFSNIIEIVNRKIEIDCYLWLFNVPYTKSKIVVSAATKKTIRINLTGGIKAMKIADKSLKDLNYGPDYILGPNLSLMLNTVKAISQETDYTQYGFTFVPHENPDFYGSNNSDFCGVINRQNSVTGDFLFNNTFIGNRYALVPWLYLFFILTKIFEDEGLTPSGDFWTDPEMQKLLVYNNYALDKPNEDDNCYVIANTTYAYNTTTRLKLFKGPPTTFDLANGWSNSAFEYTILQAGDIVVDVVVFAEVDLRNTFYFGQYIPHFNLYIDGVFTGEQLNFPSQGVGQFSRSISYQFTALVGDIGKKIYLNNIVDPVYLPLTGLIFNVLPASYMLVTNSSEQLNIFDKKVTYKNHVKDISVSEFLSEFKTIGVHIDFDYNNASVKLNYDKNYINSNTAKDWTDKAINEFELNFEDKNKGFKVNYNFGSSDKQVEANFKKYLLSNFKGTFPTYKNIPYPTVQGSIIAVENSNQLYITSPSGTGTGYVWTYFSDNYYSLILGNGEKENFSKIAPMFMNFAENEGGTASQNKCLIPSSKQSGSSQMFGMGESDYDLRFVFLRGINQSNSLVTPEGGVYIYAGTSIYGINGDYVGNYDFNLNSEKGIIPQFVLKFLEALTNSELIEQEVRLNELDILNINVKDKIAIDGIYYIIKNVSIPISKQLKNCLAKLLKLA